MLNPIISAILVLSALCISCKKKNIDSISSSKEGELHFRHDSLHVCVPKVVNKSQLRTEAALYTQTQWQTGQVIRIKFLNGEESLQSRVKKAASEWLKYANLKFLFVSPSEQADIRIGFRYKGDRGSWSYFGTECHYIPPHEPTMNFGWLTPSTSNFEVTRTTLHEFGHALGLVHEQASPQAAIQWKKEAVYAYYTGSPNFWTKEEVDLNVFFKFKNTETNYTSFDKNSIMMYPIPAIFTVNGYSVPFNSSISETDKYFIEQRYPFSTTTRNILYPGERLQQGESLVSSDKKISLRLNAEGRLLLVKHNVQPLWSTQAFGPSVTQLWMNSNGNLSLIDNNWKTYWQTNSPYYAGAFFMVENDGSASIYHKGLKIWNTTFPSQRP